MAPAAFRRRILIEPAQSHVVAELEDDWHRMVVTIDHDGAVARAVIGEMKRWPWTTCPGAIAKLAETFNGQALAEFGRRGAKTHNCTHLHDLAVLAAAHAGGSAPVAYDVTISDPVDGQREARLVHDGIMVLDWALDDSTVLAPPDIAGLTLYTLNDWIAGLAPMVQEQVRILRWAAIMAYGRGMDIPEGLSATAFPSASCFTFQPTVAVEGVRRPDVPRDFSTNAPPPIADRSPMFRNPLEVSSCI